jgi:hypothetical protein
MKIKPITINLLLAFVLLSIGFAVGKEVTLRRQIPAAAPESPETAAHADRIIVHYLHATVRCATCNEIERLTRTLVETGFAADVAAGRIEWREGNYQTEEELAKRFDLTSSCVVIERIKNGKPDEFQLMDDIWIHYKNPEAFNQYIGSAVQKYIEALKQ